MPFVHITKRMSATRPADVNHFSPLITHSSPSRTAWVLNRLGSEPPWGSVIEYAENMSWFSSGSSHRFFCSLGAEGGEHLHVAGVGGGGAEHLRGRPGSGR